MTEGQPKTGGATDNLIKKGLAFVFAAVLLWLAFKDADFAKIWGYASQTKPVFVGLLIVSAIFSHFLRAFRWTFLLAPLKAQGEKVGLFNSFYAVMLGYAVNVAIPRGGEVARLVAITKDERLPWAGVLPTMLIDRMLDLAMLVFLLGGTLLVLPAEILKDMPWLVPGGISMLVATVAGLGLLPFAGSILQRILALSLVKDKVPGGLLSKLTDLAGQFDTGTQSLKSPVKYPIIAGLSVLIWFFYWLNFYLMVFAFGLEGIIDATKCLIVFTIGSVGVLVPTPGSVGSFHFLVTKGLTMTGGINADQALAFATVLHFVAFIVATCVPAFVLFVVKRGRQ